MTKSFAAALFLGLVAAVLSPSARAADDAPAPPASQPGEAKQFDEIKVTLDTVAIDGANADVVLRMDNLSGEEKSIAFLLFFEAQSESGELGDYDYAKTNCDGPSRRTEPSPANWRSSFPRRRTGSRSGSAKAWRATWSPSPSPPDAATRRGNAAATLSPL